MIKESTIYFTPQMQSVIEEYENVRDLGVIVSNNAEFLEHIDLLIKKVRKVIGWILRSFLNRSLEFMKRMWISIVRPLIDYGSQIWSPQEGPLMDRIEKLQYDFSKLIPEIRNMSYEMRLKKMNLSSLQRRFERYKIFYTWNIIQGIVPECGLNIRSMKNSRNGLKFEVKKTEKSRIGKIRDQSFQVSAPKIWNSLPIFIRNLETTSKAEFKTALDSYLRDIPDIPRLGYSTWAKNSLVDILGF